MLEVGLGMRRLICHKRLSRNLSVLIHALRNRYYLGSILSLEPDCAKLR